VIISGSGIYRALSFPARLLPLEAVRLQTSTISYPFLRMAMERFTASRPAPRTTIFRISGFDIVSAFARKYKDRAIAVYFLRIIAADKSNHMQKNILFLALLFIFSFSDGFSQNRSIRFNEKPWQEIVALAKKENRMIFLDAYASWCGPCKWMAANMFTIDTIADYYNKTFICASIDMEKGEGISLRKKYGIRAYPSLLFLSPDENMVHEKVGAAQKVQDYFDMAMVAQNPEECLAAYIKKYNAGNNSPQFIQTYLYRLADAYIPVNTVMSKYFATQNSCIYVAPLNTRTPAMLLREICFEICKARPFRSEECLSLIAVEMAKERRLVVIDEADLLGMQILEMLRNVSEMYSFPVLLIGEDHKLDSKIASRRRLSSRIRRRLEFSAITPADVLQYLKKSLNVKIAPEVCTFIHRSCEGNWRPLLVRAAGFERALRASGMNEITMSLAKEVA